MVNQRDIDLDDPFLKNHTKIGEGFDTAGCRLTLFRSPNGGVKTMKTIFQFGKPHKTDVDDTWDSLEQCVAKKSVRYDLSAIKREYHLSDVE